MTGDSSILRCAKRVGLVIALVSHGAWAAEGAPRGAEAPPLREGRWVATYESWQLPAGETMGMVGGRMLWGLGDGWHAGPATYGAVRGQRGGFITLGLEAERQWTLGAGWTANAGVFVGGGGGRGGLELAGGGLMLRTHVGLDWAFTPRDRLGVGLSHVRFPSEGAIRSTQPYLRYEHRFDAALTLGWSSQAPANWAPLAWKEHGLALRWRRMKPDASSSRVEGGRVQQFDLLGVAWTAHPWGDGRWLGLAADGALGGGSAGYMQILAQAGWRQNLGSGAHGGLWVAAGPAGGGGVDTGGGLLTEIGVGFAQRIHRDWLVEVGWVRQRAPGGRFDADGWQVGLRYQPGVSGETGTDWTGRPLRVRALHQTYRGQNRAWRSFDADEAVQLAGLAVDAVIGRAPGGAFGYVTGQGVAAHTGRAGAYMAGLVGAGVSVPLAQRWSLEAEGLFGAAGGGGLRTGGGLVGQWQVGLGWRLGRHWSATLSAGQLRAFNGDLRARLVGVALTYDATAWVPGR
ncbi:hypothetical protein Tsedi_02306 [Tepidimonas sediminis]|uniref:Capsule assembly protein Wzi n=1 Tax=Tepidimonas sediminis TaxID=2588941 RepID=A0A554WHF4_9BURK|nr:hypothetical protein [Tepidimonas sediminis]TSE23011.1 hypothetical protein Tsedi_02306 [Tepidimonas sediminis]